MNIEIRLEQEQDYRTVEELTREAFWNLFVPGCSEHLLAHQLRKSPAFIPELDFVAVMDGQIVGNIMFCRSKVKADGGQEQDVITFGPVSVWPQYQGKGIGSALIKHAIHRATEMGFNAILTYGDPAYYRRFGFGPAEAYHIRTAEGSFLDALIAMELYSGALKDISGRFDEGEAYRVDEAELDEFDQTFPHKEKRVTESQKRFAELSNQG